jgi:hypothetical protein
VPLAVEQDGYSEFRKLQPRTRVSEAHWKDLADEVGFDLEKGLATPHLEVRLSKRDGSSRDPITRSKLDFRGDEVRDAPR